MAETENELPVEEVLARTPLHTRKKLTFANGRVMIGTFLGLEGDFAKFDVGAHIVRYDYAELVRADPC